MLKPFAAIIACRKVAGYWEVLLQDSETTISKYQWQGVQTKFPGGSGESSDTSFLGIAEREFSEETDLRLRGGTLPRVIYEVIDGDQHKKFFLVLIELLEGELRKEIRLDGSSRLFPPYWVRIDQSGLERKIFRSHRPAFRRAVSELKALDRVL